MRSYNAATAILFCLVMALILGACSPRPYMKIFYQLPPPPNTLEGKSLSLTIADDGIREIAVSQNARKSLKDFNDTFTLVVSRENGTGDLVGIYDLSSLLAEVFTRRLQQLGIHVLSLSEENGLELKITLKRFKLDLSDRKWVVDMAYRADLIKDGRMISGRTISGEARRLKILGKNELEKVTGELLSDMVNRLDVAQLLHQAGS